VLDFKVDTMSMEVRTLQFASSGGVSETTLPGTWVVGNHYTGTITVQCIPYSNTGTSSGNIAMFGIFTIVGFQNIIDIPLAGATGPSPMWGSDITVNFDVYCLSTPEINYVLNANGGAGEFIINVVVDKNL